MALKISSTPDLNVNMPNIIKIEKLLNDSAYSELIEFSANFNTRLCVERKLRMPFLDPQTGVAQKHSNLYMKRTQRMPGMRDGQIYSYPSLRWRNKSNSLKLSSRPFFRFRANDNCPTTMTTSIPPNPITNINSNSNSQPAIPNATVDGETSDFQALIDESNSMTGADTDSKDSSQEVPKEWYYDDINDNDAVSEEQPDSDFDYNINGYKRKKKGTVRKGASRKTKDTFGGSEEVTSIPKKSRSSAGGGRSGASGSRNSRSKKGTSTRSAKNNKTVPEPLDIEPPSFDSVQGDLKLNENSADSFAYRKFLN
ncbi:zinc finger protein DPF3 [Chironomus tepperi]|uniref:zinc finger protein DPF3 n=1 Tax=Chironomus tepperi TaxID=113505 RepID=UPI00391FA0F2